MDYVSILNIVLVVLVFVVFGLGMMYLYIIYRNKNKSKEEIRATEKGKKSGEYSSSAQGNLPRESIYRFMEFDEVKDNMIIRKNRTQYVMVIQCQGVNYDLMSEQEKIAVEEGFVQFLNTLRFQIQLYVQTRSLNLKDIIDGYKDKVKNVEQEIDQIRNKMRVASEQGNIQALDKLRYEEKRKINILEYGADISDYIGRMSLNRNVLQQKTYVIVSYFASELGNVSNYSKDEIDNMCFSELYTRCQSVIRSLASCEVSGRILNSEELAELLYIAYNRDDSEVLQLSKALDAEYDALYSTSKDVLKKKEDILNKKIEEEAVELATRSIISADEQLEKEREEKEERERRIKKRALKLVDEYRDQMEDGLYERVVEEVNGSRKPQEEFVEVIEEDEEVKPQKKSKAKITAIQDEQPKKRRGRPKKEEAVS